MASGRSAGLILALAAAACAPPAIVLLAAFGARVGVWNASSAYEMIGWRVGPLLAGLGLLLAVLAAVAALRSGVGRLASTIAMIIGLTTVGVYGWRYAGLAAGPDAVTTDRTEVPAWGPLAGQQGQGGPSGFADCPPAVVVSTQMAPEVVVYVLQKHGVRVVRAGVTGVYGVRTGFWFGFEHDVAVRIRPRRTDIRVAAGDTRRHSADACRLAAAISRDLSVRP